MWPLVYALVRGPANHRPTHIVCAQVMFTDAARTEARFLYNFALYYDPEVT